MGIIYKYSPFKTKDELFEKFDLIEGDSGTLVVIYNLVLNQYTDGPELEITNDPKDLLISYTANSDK